MSAKQRVKRVWLLPVTMLVIAAAVLLSIAPSPSSGGYASIELRFAPGSGQRASEMPEQTVKPVDAVDVHEDNHPPTF